MRTRLLINYTNERLQLLFWEQILVKEQQLYRSEGLLLDEIPLPDGRPVARTLRFQAVCELLQASFHGLEVLESLDSVLDVLDDCCLRRLRAGGHFSDQALTDAARRRFRAAREGFVVRHYAQEVGRRMVACGAARCPTVAVAGWMPMMPGRCRKWCSW